MIFPWLFRFFKFHDFSMHGTFFVIFQDFHEFQSLWEPCKYILPTYCMEGWTELSSVTFLVWFSPPWQRKQLRYKDTKPSFVKGHKFLNAPCLTWNQSWIDIFVLNKIHKSIANTVWQPTTNWRINLQTINLVTSTTRCLSTGVLLKAA